MAYIDQGTGRNQRAAVMTAVALIQGAVVVALINGLAVTFIERPPPLRIEGDQIPLTPIPRPIPPPPEPPVIQRDQPERLPPMPLPPIGSAGERLPPPPLPPDPLPTQTIDPPPPPPPPQTITPRAPKPRNAPGNWATPDDYPARDLREGNQGVTGFTLTVGADGRVQSCAVVRSSGFLGLDKATCDNVARRARFEPATDGGGNRASGTYRGSITWLIPRD